MIRMLVVAMLAGAAPGAAPAPLAPFSSDRNDYNLSMDRSGRLAVFARSDADFANASIFVSEKRGGRWSRPAPIAFSDPRWSDSDPWLTPDGRTLYFISTRPTPERGERTDYDIWRVKRAGAGWGTPEHLGDGINGRGPELGPEVHGTTLTFAAARRSGRGGLDIYAAPLEGDRVGAPALLDGPFNSAESDSDFTLSADGRTAAFWRGGAETARIFVARKGPQGWSEPQPLPASVNLGPFNFTPAFGPDGRTLSFASTAPREGQAAGLADIFVAKLP